MKLLAIDPSLTCSGWACFELQSEKVIAFGELRPPGPRMPLEDRLKILQIDIKDLFSRLNLGERDYLVTEGPATLVKNPSSAQKVEQVRGLFEYTARSLSLTVLDRVNPRTLQLELLSVRGKQLPRAEIKLQAKQVAKRIYPQIFKLKSDIKQDVIDALLVGTLTISKVKRCSLC